MISFQWIYGFPLNFKTRPFVSHLISLPKWILIPDVDIFWLLIHGQINQMWMWNSEHKFKTHPLATQHSCRENHHLWKVNHLNGPCSHSIAGVSPGWPRHTMAFTNFRRNLSCASRLATPKLRQRSKFRTKRACCSARDPKKRQTNQVGTWRSRDSQTFGFQLQPINPIYLIHIQFILFTRFDELLNVPEERTLSKVSCPKNRNRLKLANYRNSHIWNPPMGWVPLLTSMGRVSSLAGWRSRASSCWPWQCWHVELKVCFNKFPLWICKFHEW